MIDYSDPHFLKRNFAKKEKKNICIKYTQIKQKNKNLKYSNTTPK